jgi:hypothetical protein
MSDHARTPAFAVKLDNEVWDLDVGVVSKDASHISVAVAKAAVVRVLPLPSKDPLRCAAWVLG